MFHPVAVCTLALIASVLPASGRSRAQAPPGSQDPPRLITLLNSDFVVHARLAAVESSLVAAGRCRILDESQPTEALSADPGTIALAELEFFRGYAGSKRGAVAFGSSDGQPARGGQSLDPDPEGRAQEIARSELALLQRAFAEGRFKRLFGVSDKRVFEKTTLGSPFIHYGPGDTFARAEWRDGATLLKSLRPQIWFPVLSEGSVVGAIMIIALEDGSYEWVGDVNGGALVEAMELFVRQSSVASSQRVSAMLYRSTGRFAVIEDGARIISMRPLDSETLRICGADGERPAAWLSPEHVIPKLRSHVVEDAVRERP